jgi:cytochrome P450
MIAKRRDLSIPAWESDELDSPVPPKIEDPYFDQHLNSWVLSRHGDVLAAFHAPALALVGPKSNKVPEDPGHRTRLQMRADTLEALSPTKLHDWREQLLVLAHRLLGTLPIDQPLDLLNDYARPLGLALAVMVTGPDPDDAEHLEKLARQVSVSSAEPYDATLRAAARTAEAELQPCFHAGPLPLRDSGFVALAETLPCLLTNAWFGLLRHPGEWTQLHHQPLMRAQAMEELLRYAGLTRILFRKALADTNVNGTQIREGERVILRLFAANHDPDRFVHPDRFDQTRRGTSHLTLGAGPHACVGANLIRTAALAINQPLLERFIGADLIEPIEWEGGAGFRAPKGLKVWLHASL